MLAKAALVIVVMAVTAAGVLSVRQQRLQAVHDTARSIEQATQLDRRWWSLRLELASRLDPAALEATLVAVEAELGGFESLPSDWWDALPADVAREVRLRHLVEGEVLDPWRASTGTESVVEGVAP